jgi:hypothetical protein
MKTAPAAQQSLLEAAVCNEFQLPHELRTSDSILQFLLAKLDYVPVATEQCSDQPALDHNPSAAAKWLSALDEDDADADADADAAGPSDEVHCGPQLTPHDLVEPDAQTYQAA